MADSDFSAEFKAVGEAMTNLARKAEAVYGEEIKSFLDAVKTKVSELEKRLDEQRTKRQSG
jgi:hypothetical protein